MLKTLVSTFQTVMGSSLSQQSAVDIISHWRSKPPHELIFDSNRRELYIQAVDRLQQSPQSKENSELLSIAMARLKREFHAVLSRQADYQVGPGSTTEWSSVNDSTAYILRYEDYVVSEAPSKEVVIYLRSIAERMKLSGKIGECISLYKNVRKTFLQSQLRKLRFEELSIGNNTKRFMWDELRVKIELWTQVSKICLKILFEREKQFCGQIFQGVGTNAERDECFLGTVQDFGVSLFGFAEAVSLSNQPYDRLETVLGLYDAFVWVLPNVNALFLCESGKGIINGCTETLSRIETEVVRMLHDLQNAVLREIPNVSDDRGAVHQSTKYVMDKVYLIVRNKRLLTSLIKSTPSLNFDGTIIPQADLGESRNRSFLDLHLILMIVVLQRSLESKSKRHKDPSLGNLFLMNNIRYIVRKIEGSNELQEMIGESFLKKLNENVALAMSRYQESTCSKFLICLQDDGLYVTTCFRPRLSKSTLRKRLKTFNSVYEEIHFLHSSWTVPDTQLMEEIRASMAKQLVPAYKNFLEKLTSNPEFKPLDKNIKYSAQDFQDLILEKLFSDTDIVID